MASLLSWAGNGLKRVANTVNNDVLKPIQRDVVQPVQHVAAPVVQRAQAAVAQVNPLDSGRTYNTVMQRGPQYTPRVNTSLLQQATHNGLTNASGSFLNNVTGIPSVIDAARLGVGELTHNQPAINNATTSLAKNLPRFLPIGMAESFKNGFGQDIATAATAPFAERAAKQQGDYVRKLYNNNTSDKIHNAAVESLANATENSVLNQHLGTVGLDQNTPTSQVVRKVGGDAANTAANIALVSKLPGLAKTSASGKVVQASLKKQALTYGGINAVAGIAQTATNPNATPLDYLKSSGLGFATGAALPVAFHAAPTVVRGGAKVSKNAPTIIDANNLAAKATSNRQLAESRLAATSQKIGAARNAGRSSATLDKQLANDQVSLIKAKVLEKAAIANRDKSIGLSTKNVSPSESNPQGIPKAKPVSAKASSANGTPKPNVPEVGYRSSHQITDSTPIHNAPIDNMVAQVKGKYGLTNYDQKDIANLKKIAADPNADVKIYRASPANELNHGDWVTTSKTYAQDIKRQNGGKVYEHTVKASQLHLPNNIEDNPSLARFSAFKYQKESVTQPTQGAIPAPEKISLSQNLKAATPVSASSSLNGDLAKAPTNKAGLSQGPSHTAKASVSSVKSQGINETGLRKSQPAEQPPQQAGALNTSPKPSVSPLNGEFQANPLNDQQAKTPATGRQRIQPTSQKSQSLGSQPDNTINQRGLTTSIKQSANFSKDLKKNIASQYAVVGDKQTVINTQKYLSSQSFDKAHTDVLQRLQSTKRPDKQLVNDAGTVMQVLDSKGKVPEAQHIHDLLSEHLTNAGQTSQAAALLLRRSPDGIYHKAVSDLKKAGTEVTPSIDKQLQGFREAIRSTAPDSTQRDIAVQKMRQFVSQNIPSSAKDKIFAVWRAGLLSGPRTVAKIITSHGIHLPLETVKDVPAAAFDKALSYLTGQRSLVLTGKGFGEGFKSGTKAGFGKQGYLRTGIDMQPGSNAVEFHNQTNFGPSVAGRIVSGYANGIGRLHGSFYKPFYGAEFKNSIYSQAKAAAKTAGLKGQASQDFVNNFAKTPPHEALDVAQKDAENATFQQKTALGQGASAIQKIPGVGRYIAPFTRIPSAIGTDLFNYSVAGGAKSVFKAVNEARAGEGLSVAGQRELVQGLGRAVVGTGVLVPGYMLYQRGMVTLEYPSNDPKQQKLWQLEGKKANSVLIDGKWRSFGSLGPFGAVLALGAGVARGKQQSGNIVAGIPEAAGVAVKSLEDQPYVSGITQAASALQDPGRYLTALEKQYAGSVIPTGVAQVASATDNLSRKANTPIDTVKSKIPGLRQSLAPTKNAFGQNVPNAETGIATVLDPFYSSNALNTSPLTKELQRLNDAGQGVLPSTQPAKNTFDGVKTQLTKPQAQALGASIGSNVQNLWNQTINFSGYKNLPADQQHQMLANILSDNTTALKEKYAAANQLGQYAPGYNGTAKPLSQKQQNILDGTFNPADYVPKQAKAPAYTTQNGVRVKAPKVAKAKSTKSTKSTSSKGAPRTTLASYLKTFKATNAAVKPPKAPKAPSFKVATTKLPASYKQTKIKNYTVAKVTAGKAKNKSKIA